MQPCGRQPAAAASSNNAVFIPHEHPAQKGGTPRQDMILTQVYRVAINGSPTPAIPHEWTDN